MLSARRILSSTSSCMRLTAAVRLVGSSGCSRQLSSNAATTPKREPRRYGVKTNALKNNTFKTCMNKLYRTSHPDILTASFPQLASVNSESYQVLNDILGTIKEVNSYPVKMQQTIPIYVKKEGTNVPVKIDLVIKTPGGDCRKVFQRAFEQFFVAAGILQRKEKFDWGTEYFPNEVGTVKSPSDAPGQQ